MKGHYRALLPNCSFLIEAVNNPARACKAPSEVAMYTFTVEKDGGVSEALIKELLYPSALLGLGVMVNPAQAMYPGDRMDMQYAAARLANVYCLDHFLTSGAYKGWYIEVEGRPALRYTAASLNHLFEIRVHPAGTFKGEQKCIGCGKPASVLLENTTFTYSEAVGDENGPCHEDDKTHDPVPMDWRLERCIPLCIGSHNVRELFEKVKQIEEPFRHSGHMSMRFLNPYLPLHAGTDNGGSLTLTTGRFIKLAASVFAETTATLMKNQFGDPENHGKLDPTEAMTLHLLHGPPAIVHLQTE